MKLKETYLQAKKIGTKFLTEDQFLQLITDKSDSKPTKQKENKTPPKNEIKPQKIAKDEPKEEKVKVEAKSPLAAKSAEVRAPKIPKIQSEDLKSEVKKETTSVPSSGMYLYYIEYYRLFAV